jgi:histidyl-tRNA synthetase
LSIINSCFSFKILNPSINAKSSFFIFSFFKNNKKELLNKGITISQADRLLEYCKMNDKPKIQLEKFKESNEFMNKLKAKQSFEEIEVLFDYLSVLNILDYFRFDLSLSRGLDIYTGLIYKVILTDSGKMG